MEYLKPCPFCGCKWKKVGITRISFLLYHDPNCFFWCIGYPVMEHSAGDGNMPKRIIKWNKRAGSACKMHPTTIGNKRHIAVIREYECLSCEGLIAVYANDEKPRYCPHCGAEVVGD